MSERHRDTRSHFFRPSARRVDCCLRRLQVDAGAVPVGLDGVERPALGDHLEFRRAQLRERGGGHGGGSGKRRGGCRLEGGGAGPGEGRDPGVRVGGAQSRLEVRDLFLQLAVFGAQIFDFARLAKPLTHVLPP